MEFLQDLVSAQRVTSQLKDLIGRNYGLTMGLIVDRDDPAHLGRVRVTTASKGSLNRTDWLLRGQPAPDMSLPVPEVGDIVAVWWVDGDPHQGFYAPVVTNVNNPQGSLNGFSMTLGGKILVTMEPDQDKVTLDVAPRGHLELTGHSFKVSTGWLTMILEDDGHISFDGMTKWTVNGQEQYQDLEQNNGDPWLYE